MRQALSGPECVCVCVWGGGGPGPLSPEKIAFLSNYIQDHMKKTQSYQASIQCHPMLGHRQHAGETPFKWRFIGGPMNAVKNAVKVGPPLTKFSASAYGR